MECGIGIEGFNGMQGGDTINCFTTDEKRLAKRILCQ